MYRRELDYEAYMFFMVIALLLMLLPACSSTSNYTVLVCDVSDSAVGVVPAFEYRFWCDDVADPATLEQNVTVLVDQKEVSGTFRASANISPNNYTESRYFGENGTSFSIDANGDLVSYRRIPSKEEMEQPHLLTQEEYLENARNFLGEMVDVDLYQVESEFHEGLGEYIYKFTKYIGDYKTADSATIYMLPSGEITGFYSSMLGRISMDTPIDFDHREVAEAVQSRLDSIYADVKNQYDDMRYQIEPGSITLLDDGNVAIIVEVDIECITYYSDGSSSSISEFISFVVL